MSGRPRNVVGRAPPPAPAARPGGITALDIRGMQAGGSRVPRSSRSTARTIDEKSLAKMDARSATRRLQRWQRQGEGSGIGLGFFEEAKLTMISLKRNIFGTSKAPPPWIAKGRKALSVITRNPFKKKKKKKKDPPPKEKDKRKKKGKKSKRGKRGGKDSKLKKSQSEKEKEEEQFVEPKPVELEIPTTVGGLVTLGARTRAKNLYLTAQSRVEYAKRKRQLHGPSALEMILTDVIGKPFAIVWMEVSFYVAAYVRVDDAFNVQRARIRRKRGQLIDIEDLECVTWHTLEALKERIIAVIGFLTVVSILIGVAINEINFRGFIPSWALDCRNPASGRDQCYENPCSWTFDERIPGKPRQELTCLPTAATEYQAFQYLKLCNTILTAFIIYSIYISYRYDANILSLRNHVEFNNKGLEKSSLYRVGLLLPFFGEVLMFMVHQIPYVQFDVIIDTLIFSEIPSVYTSDSVLGVFLFLRVYVIWRWFKLRTFRSFDSRAYAIRLTDEPMSHLLAIKILIRESPFALLAGIAALIILTTSYVYRVVESSQNRIMSVYYWDALWFSADTMTGLAFADPGIYPRSVLGRLVAVLCRMLGMAWTALLITSVREFFKFGSFEIHALRWLELTRLTSLRKTSAARCIQYMWTYGAAHANTLRQLARFKIISGKLRLFNASHRLPEATNFDMFVQSTLKQKHQVSMLVEQQAGFMKDFATSMAPKKQMQTARKVLTHRRGGDDEPKSARKTARFEAFDSANAKAAVGAAGRNFGSYTNPKESSEVDFALPGEVASHAPVATRLGQGVQRSSRTANVPGVSSRAWISGGNFGDTRRNSSQSGQSSYRSNDGSSEGGNTARSSESKSRRSSYYTGDDPLSARGSRSNPQGKSQPAQPFRPFSKNLMPTLKRSGSFWRAEERTKLATRAQASSKPVNLSEALFTQAEDDQYKLVINRGEREQMKNKEVKKQAEDATKILEMLRDSNDHLLLSLGYEPERPKPAWESEDAKVQHQWERDWDKRLQVVESKIKSMDENLMATLGQIMLLVQGLYSARKGAAPGKPAAEGQEHAAENLGP